jgi:hypothetical protein
MVDAPPDLDRVDADAEAREQKLQRAGPFGGEELAPVRVGSGQRRADAVPRKAVAPRPRHASRPASSSDRCDESGRKVHDAIPRAEGRLSSHPRRRGSAPMAAPGRSHHPERRRGWPDATSSYLDPVSA